MKGSSFLEIFSCTAKKCDAVFINRKSVILGIKKAPATFGVTGVCNGLKFVVGLWYNEFDK